MLSELIDVALDVAETCGPCSGNDPSNAAWPGAAGAAPAAGGPGSDNNGGGGGGEEKNRQRKNADNTIAALLWEVLTRNTGGLGKVLGPAATVVSASETLAEGVANVQSSDAIREDKIYRDSGGAMGTPLGGNSGSGR